MKIDIPVSDIPAEHREVYVRLALQKAAKELGYVNGSHGELEFINRETRAILKNGHPAIVSIMIDDTGWTVA